MPCRVFVVEDDPALCQLIAKYLTCLGHQVETSLTAKDAWSANSDRAGDIPSVFIIDLGLPDMDGADLARRILDIQPQTRILLTSGYPSGVSGIGPHVSFLMKPFSPDRLSEELTRIGQEIEGP